MMRGGRRILITVWSSSRTSGCSSQGLSEMHWEGKERERERSGYISWKIPKDLDPVAFQMWGNLNCPLSHNSVPHTLLCCFSSCKQRQSLFNTNTNTHKHRATQHNTTKCPIQWSDDLIFFFHLPLPLLLCFSLGIYQWSPSIDESKEQDSCQTSGMDWADSNPQGHAISVTSAPLWLLLQQFCLALHSGFKKGACLWKTWPKNHGTAETKRRNNFPQWNSFQSQTQRALSWHTVSDRKKRKEKKRKQIKKFKKKRKRKKINREQGKCKHQLSEKGRKTPFVKLVRPLLPDPTVSTNGISRFKSIPSLLSWLVNGETTWLRGKSSFKACAVIIRKD